MPPSDPQVFEFGPFRADVRKRILERDGAPVALSGKAFEILVALLNRAGEVADKESLMREVWPDTAVEDNNLTVNISWLRKALGEAPNDPRYIVTIPGRGYRFIGDLRAPEAKAEGGSGPSSASRRGQMNFASHEDTINLPFPKAGTWTERLDEDVRPSPSTIQVATAGDVHGVTVPSNYGFIFVL